MPGKISQTVTDTPADISASAPPTGSAGQSAADSAEYIAVLASQLQRVAQANGHDFLAYLIDMVVVEAWRIAGPDADRSDKGLKGAGDRR